MPRLCALQSFRSPWLSEERVQKSRRLKVLEGPTVSRAEVSRGPRLHEESNILEGREFSRVQTSQGRKVLQGQGFSRAQSRRGAKLGKDPESSGFRSFRRPWVLELPEFSRSSRTQRSRGPSFLEAQDFTRSPEFTSAASSLGPRLFKEAMCSKADPPADPRPDPLDRDGPCWITERSSIINAMTRVLQLLSPAIRTFPHAVGPLDLLCLRIWTQFSFAKLNAHL